MEEQVKISDKIYLILTSKWTSIFTAQKALNGWS